MEIPASAGFKLVDANTGAQVFQGTLVVSGPDSGYTYTPTPYQKVYEADFTSFNTPGEYRLVVPGHGRLAAVHDRWRDRHVLRARLRARSLSPALRHQYRHAVHPVHA